MDVLRAFTSPDGSVWFQGVARGQRFHFQADLDTSTREISDRLGGLFGVGNAMTLFPVDAKTNQPEPPLAGFVRNMKGLRFMVRLADREHSFSVPEGASTNGMVWFSVDLYLGPSPSRIDVCDRPFATVRDYGTRLAAELGRTGRCVLEKRRGLPVTEVPPEDSLLSIADDLVFVKRTEPVSQGNACIIS